MYPKASPGGWQLIGTTPLAMFDINRTPAALLQPGFRVRFRDMAKGGTFTASLPAKAQSAAIKAIEKPSKAAAAIEVVSVGFPVCLQDLGRVGLASQGISRSGAADRGSLKASNRLVGNEPGAAALEVTLGNFRFRMQGKGVMALTGAPASLLVVTASGERFAAAHNKSIALDDGDIVTLGAPAAGMRSYLAFRGGFDMEAVLGSGATDTLAQIGPPLVSAGATMALRQPACGTLVSTEDLPDPAFPKAGEEVVLDVFMGPRTDWFAERAIDNFLSQEWLVTGQSSRVGIRLEGEPLERAIVKELPSEATLHGAIQVPASGQPVLFLADHPLTGGYPVIANVAGYHLDLAGQIPPGVRIRFNPVSRFADSIISGRRA